MDQDSYGLRRGRTKSLEKRIFIKNSTLPGAMGVIGIQSEESEPQVETLFIIREDVHSSTSHTIRKADYFPIYHFPTGLGQYLW